MFGPRKQITSSCANCGLPAYEDELTFSLCTECANFEFLLKLLAIKKEHCVRLQEEGRYDAFSAITELYDDIIETYRKLSQQG